MLRDVFYYGNKPNVHPREKFVNNIQEARKICSTEHFWIINEFCDYKNFDWDFDFDFLSDDIVWHSNHNNVWPSQHCKDSGTWLCSKNDSDVIIYRDDVKPVYRKKIKTHHWKELYHINQESFDFSWHPDPTNPPYIYVWGNQHYDAATMPTIEYHVPNATQKHYIDNQLWHIKLKQNPDLFVHYEDCNGIDYSWRPNPNSPPYIYVWGNQWNKPEDKISVEFRVEGATEYKYMLERAKRKPNKEHWFIPDNIDDKNFDYSWEPNPNDPPYVYEFGTQ